jgi:hypothetical protein
VETFGLIPDGKETLHRLRRSRNSARHGSVILPTPNRPTAALRLALDEDNFLESQHNKQARAGLLEFVSAAEFRRGASLDPGGATTFLTRLPAWTTSS